MTLERWRPVVGFEDTYAVSSLGRVRREAPGRGTQVGRLLRPQPAAGGRYPGVTLMGPDGRQYSRYVHELVAEAFLGPCPEGQEVDHKDTDRWNPAVSNLEYVTRGENIARALANGVAAVGRMMRNAKLTDQAVREIRALRGVVPQSELARRYGVSPSAVSSVQRRERWRHVEEVGA